MRKPTVCTTIASFRAARREVLSKLRASSGAEPSLGLVPTMGSLHAGHAALMAASTAENDATAASVFVNPLQFAPDEDFATYPRDLEADVAKLAEAGCDLVFAPSPDDEMYGRNHRCFVVPEGFDQLSEGAARPHFFRGVATVVAKLFNIVQPTRAYFGEKDAMQCVVVQRIVEDLSMPLDVVLVPSIREADGLAMSSRNAGLSPPARAAAVALHRALRAMEARAADLRYAAGDAVPRAALVDAARAVLNDEPLVETVDYISVASRHTMEELDVVAHAEGGAVLSLAARVGGVRLIDNVLL